MKANLVKIAILEDNLFYNDLMMRQILKHTQSIEVNGPYVFEVSSYTDANSCLANFDLDTAIFFLDYYLDDGKTANDIVKRVNKFALNCHIVILSQNKRSYIIDELLAHGAKDFIHKNDMILKNISLFIDEYLYNQNKK